MPLCKYHYWWTTWISLFWFHLELLGKRLPGWLGLYRLLAAKLGTLAISGSLLFYIKRYLFGKTQFVKFKDFVSIEIKVNTGVPQGSYLDPLLFLILLIILSFVNSWCLQMTLKYSWSTNLIWIWNSTSVSVIFCVLINWLSLSKAHIY